MKMLGAQNKLVEWMEGSMVSPFLLDWENGGI